MFANELLASFYAYSDFVDSGVVREFWTERDAGACSPWHYGWDSPSEENGMQNSGLSDRAVGNNGTTGCSLWIDPERALVITLMSNCTHPTRNNKKIKGFRSKLVQQLVEIVDS